MNLPEKYAWILKNLKNGMYVMPLKYCVYVCLIYFILFYMYMFWGVVEAEYMYLWGPETLNT